MTMTFHRRRDLLALTKLTSPRSNYKEKTLETTTGNYLINRQIPDSNSTGNLAIE